MKIELLSAFAAACIVACSSDGVGPVPLPPIARAQITGTPQGSAVGVHLRLTLEAIDSAGRTVMVVWAPRWSTSDSTVAHIDPDGMLTTLHIGRTMLRATVDAQGRTFSDSLLLLVVQPTS